jgi:PAS domain S-box-containing protein
MRPPPAPGLIPDEFYRLIIETTHEGIWMADLNKVTTFVNPQMARMLGATPVEMIGRPVFDFVFDCDQEAVRSHFGQFLETPTGTSLEERLRRKDGSEMYALVSASVFRDGEGRPTGFLGMFTDCTERKRTEVALRQSEARLQLQIRRMPMAQILWSRDFRVLSWNPASERIFGYTEAEALGKKPWNLIVPAEAQAEVRLVWERLLRGDTAAHSVNRNVTRDGRVIVCEWHNTPLTGAGGAVEAVLSMAQDVTQREQTEAALREAHATLERRVAERTQELTQSHHALAESEERYRRLFETISDAAFLLDGETKRFVEANSTALDLYGYTREEFVGLSYRALTAEPGDSTTTINLALARGSARVPVRYHRKKDGTVFPVEVSASSFRVRGKPMVCGIARDITARKQAEEALQRSERELADFFAESPLGLLWVDPEGRVLRANKAQLHLAGWAAESAGAHSVGDLLASKAAADELLKRLARGETIQNFRTLIRTSSGALKDALVDANGLRDAGRLTYSRWFVRDITRTVRLEREILRIAEQEQRRLGRDLHDDLCQQLAGIEFLVHALALDLSRTNAKAARQCKEIARMVQSAMTETRTLAHGLCPLGLEAGNLNAGLQDLARRTRKVFRLDCRYAGPAPASFTDPKPAIHLYRIAQEAVANAVKHSGARRVRISLRRNRAGHLVLAIRDNGAGMPEALPPHHGMGLQVMRYRAEAIGGALRIERRRAGGTAVICVLNSWSTASSTETSP